MLILGIDLGSTAFKAAVFDANLRRLGEGSVPLVNHFAPGGVVEFAVNQAQEAVRQVIRGALDAAQAAPADLAAVAITSQAQTFTVTDRHGMPKLPFISWQDARADRGHEALLRDAEYVREFGKHCTFPEPGKTLQLAEVRHLQETRPGFIGADDRVVSLPEYITRLATGRYVVDANLAAMSGFYSLREGDWWPLALRLSGLRREQLAELIPVGTSAGITVSAARDSLGLPPGIPLILAGNDQTAGAYGARVQERHAVLITLGTAQVAYTCEPPVTDRFAPGKVASGPYPGGARYHMAVEAIGGNVVKWAERMLAGGETDDAFFALAAEAPPGANGLVFIPDLPDSAGRWEGLGLHHTPADLARSVLEALAERLAALIDLLGLDLAKTPVLAAGGGSRHPVWVKLLADRLGAPIEPVQADPVEGAARMALEEERRRLACA